MKHPETELVSYVRGELAPQDRARVARHLEDCPECRRDADALREVLSRLAGSGPAAPEVHWGRWRAELRGKLEARRGRRRAWWSRPLPLALSAAVASALLVFGVWRGDRVPGGAADPLTFEETVLGGRLDLLQHYAVVERLDLLEEFDVIRNLDQLAGRHAG